MDIYEATPQSDTRSTGWVRDSLLSGFGLFRQGTANDPTN